MFSLSSPYISTIFYTSFTSTKCQKNFKKLGMKPQGFVFPPNYFPVKPFHLLKYFLKLQSGTLVGFKFLSNVLSSILLTKTHAHSRPQREWCIRNKWSHTAVVPAGSSEYVQELCRHHWTTKECWCPADIPSGKGTVCPCVFCTFSVENKQESEAQGLLYNSSLKSQYYSKSNQCTYNIRVL